jgi:hypothetical protein
MLRHKYDGNLAVCRHSQQRPVFDDDHDDDHEDWFVAVEVVVVAVAVLAWRFWGIESAVSVPGASIR